MTSIQGISRRAAKAKKPPKAERVRRARFEVWAKNIDANKDGKISRAELETRITNRTAAGKPHPYASAILNNLSSLDKDANDGLDAVTQTDAAKFLTDTFKLSEKKAKKLDASA
jgi:hypothetical protein